MNRLLSISVPCPSAPAFRQKWNITALALISGFTVVMNTIETRHFKAPDSPNKGLSSLKLFLWITPDILYHRHRGGSSGGSRGQARGDPPPLFWLFWVTKKKFEKDETSVPLVSENQLSRMFFFIAEGQSADQACKFWLVGLKQWRHGFSVSKSLC